MISSLPYDALQSMLEALPVRIFWKDRESRYLGCNQLFADDAGISDPAEFIGKSDYYFFEPQQAAAFRDDDADVIFTGQPKLRIIERLTHVNCSVRWLETSKFPLRDSEGHVWGVIGMYQDITEQKRAEEIRAA